MGKGNYIKFALLIMLIGIFPLIIKNTYIISIFVFAGIYSIVAIGLSMLMGYAGQISLGHAGFFAIGGYSSAILTKAYGWNTISAMMFGVGLSILAALLIGIPSLRLRGHYLAMATLGFGEIIYVISKAAVNLTDGPQGFSGVPPMSFGGIVFKSELSKYFFIWAIAVIVLIVSLNIINSRSGRALRSIHGDETAAGSLGVNVSFYKLQVFIYSAILTSIAGSFYVHHMRFVSPSGFTLNKSILFLIMIMSGGMGSLWGAVFGAALFTLLPELLSVFKDYDILIYGIVLLLMMMFLPEGLAGILNKLKTRIINKLKKRVNLNQ